MYTSQNTESEEDGVRIEITREIDGTAPFPPVNQNSTLNRTSQIDLAIQREEKTTPKPTTSKEAGSPHEQTGKDEDVNDLAVNATPNVKTPNRLMKMLKSTPTSAMNFLGIESSPQPVAFMSKSADVTDSAAGGASNIRNKTLTNWDQRTFRVLNTNPIFGGKVKESKIESYLEQLNEDNAEISNPFLYYKLNGSSLDLSKSKQKITVGKMASEGLNKVFKVRIILQFKSYFFILIN